MNVIFCLLLGENIRFNLVFSFSSFFADSFVKYYRVIIILQNISSEGSPGWAMGMVNCFNECLEDMKTYYIIKKKTF